MSQSTKSAATAFLLAFVLVVGVAGTARAFGPEANLKAAKSDVYSIKTVTQDQQALTAKADQARADAAKKWQEKYAAAETKKKAAYDHLKSIGYGYDPANDVLTPLDDPKKPLTFNAKKPAAVDLDKLSKAVAVAETSGCTDGTALKRNNCHGIMCWDKKGKRFPCYFASKAASHAAFKKIWAKSYKQFPDMALAKKWTGNDHADTWLAHVTQAYNSL